MLARFNPRVAPDPPIPQQHEHDSGDQVHVIEGVDSFTEPEGQDSHEDAAGSSYPATPKTIRHTPEIDNTSSDETSDDEPYTPHSRKSHAASERAARVLRVLSMAAKRGLDTLTAPRPSSPNGNFDDYDNKPSGRVSVELPSSSFLPASRFPAGPAELAREDSPTTREVRKSVSITSRRSEESTRTNVTHYQDEALPGTPHAAGTEFGLQDPLAQTSRKLSEGGYLTQHKVSEGGYLVPDPLFINTVRAAPALTEDGSPGHAACSHTESSDSQRTEVTAFCEEDCLGPKDNSTSSTAHQKDVEAAEAEHDGALYGAWLNGKGIYQFCSCWMPVVDVAFDVWVLCQWANKGNWDWFAIGLTILLYSSGTGAYLTYVRHNFILAVLAPLQVHAPLLAVKALIASKGNFKILYQQKQIRFLAKLALFEGAFESLPMLVLQVYVLVVTRYFSLPNVMSAIFSFIMVQISAIKEMCNTLTWRQKVLQAWHLTSQLILRVLTLVFLAVAFINELWAFALFTAALCITFAVWIDKETGLKTVRGLWARVEAVYTAFPQKPSNIIQFLAILAASCVKWFFVLAIYSGYYCVKLLFVVLIAFYTPLLNVKQLHDNTEQRKCFHAPKVSVFVLVRLLEGVAIYVLLKMVKHESPCTPGQTFYSTDGACRGPLVQMEVDIICIAAAASMVVSWVLGLIFIR